jgi:hypothetical protein
MGVFASSKPKIVVSGGGGGDVTPAAVNWADVSYDSTLGLFGYTERQITGINTSITLKVQYTALAGSLVYYYVSNTSGDIVSGDGTSPITPDFYGTAIVNNGTLTVSNNQYVTFACDMSGGCSDLFTITVKNQSDGDTTLDTFNTQWQGEC